MLETTLNKKPTKVLKTTSQELVNLLSTEIKNTKRELKSIVDLRDTFFHFEIDIKRCGIVRKRERLLKLHEIIESRSLLNYSLITTSSIRNHTNEELLNLTSEFSFNNIKLKLINEVIELGDELLVDYNDNVYNKYELLIRQLDSLLSISEKYFLDQLHSTPFYDYNYALEIVLKKKERNLRRIRSHFLAKYKLFSLLIIDKRQRFRDIIRFCYKKTSDVSDDVNCFFKKTKQFLIFNITNNETRRFFKAFS